MKERPGLNIKKVARMKEPVFLSGETLYIASNRSSAAALRNLLEFSVARRDLRLC